MGFDEAVKRLAARTRTAKNGCHEYVGYHMKSGYGLVAFQGRRWLAHRLAYWAFNKNLPDGMCVLHKCDNPGCINPEHLRLGTQRDNMADMDAKGRRIVLHGSRRGRSKLVESDIPKIRERFTRGETHAAIAADYGVNRSIIGLIRIGRIWTHVPS